MKSSLIKNLEGHDVKIWIKSNRNPYCGKLIVVEDAGIVLSSEKHGRSVIDIGAISIVTEIRKRCPEINQENR